MRLVLLAALAIAAGAAGQEADAPEVSAIDRTDPADVVRAYIEACRNGDTKTALLLTTPDDTFAATMLEVGDESRGTKQDGLGLGPVLAESLCLPVGLEFTVGEPVVEQVDGGTARVTVPREYDLRQTFVMAVAADGTWAIRAFDSIKATTGADPWLARTGSGSASASRGTRQSRSRLRTLAKACHRYASDHGDRLPPAASWMDAIEPYVLDMDIFHCPCPPDRECGYAMNALIGETALPATTSERRRVPLLFEWQSAERNASVHPEGLADMESPWSDGTINLVDANGNPWRVPQGLTFEQLLSQDEHQRLCAAHLAALARAARRYARANGGMLPEADSWQDDLALYLLEDRTVFDVFRCPKAEELDYAYAINAEVAGKDATTLEGHHEIILFFESNLNVANASGAPSSDAADPARHLCEWQPRLGNLVSYLDGVVGYHLEQPE